MSKIIVVIKDEKTGGFGSSPYFYSSLPDVIRDFALLLKNSPDSKLAQFPADFSVWRVGEWSEVTGTFNILFDMEYLFHLTAFTNGTEVKIGEKPVERSVPDGR